MKTADTEAAAEAEVADTEAPEVKTAGVKAPG